MIYDQFDPHPALADYIEAYYTVRGDGEGCTQEKILPDGCVDIIFNLGADCVTDNGDFTMNEERAYLVGPMTRFKEVGMSPETKLVGIRFRPGAFAAFFKFAALHEVIDQTILLDHRTAPGTDEVRKHAAGYLDRFFLDRFSRPKPDLTAIIDSIREYEGQTRVSDLAQRHFMTVRQLERHFRQHIGISPREFINIVRFQSAYARILDNASGRSLSDIAFDCGYYDHAHLTNAMKQYTGTVPSRF